MNECPKCGYVRQATDTAPDYECPRCGIVYEKFIAAAKARAEAAERESKRIAKMAHNMAGNAAAPMPPQTDGGIVPNPSRVSPREVICTTCGTLGSARQHTRGSIWIEIFLWLLLLVPGIIYSIWRHTTRGKVCGQCGGTQLIAVGTPVGRNLLAQWHPGANVDVAAPESRTQYSMGDRIVGGTAKAIVIVIAVVLLLSLIAVILR